MSTHAERNIMSRIKNVTGLLTSLVFAVGASSALAHKDKEKEKKDKNDKHQVVAVPEPATLGLFAASAAALGLTSMLRRRKPRPSK
jgi:hypothetical protein